MIGPVLRQFGVTDGELAELTNMLGPLETLRPDALVQAIALLKIQNLEKRIAELEIKLGLRQPEVQGETRAFWDDDNRGSGAV